MNKRRGILLLILAVAALGAAGARGGDDSSAVMRLNLMWTNDVHGHIAPEPARFMNPEFPPPLGGGASAAAYIKGVRRQAAADG